MTGMREFTERGWPTAVVPRTPSDVGPPEAPSRLSLAAGLDATPSAASPRTVARARYRKALNWIFTVFNSIRLLTYLPNVWAIIESGNSSQHSLWTWVAWVGANASMAAWLYEENDHRIDKAVAISFGNALMCLATCVIIVSYR